MSFHHSLVVLTCISVGPDHPAILALNAWCERHPSARGQTFMEIDTSGAGGHKVFGTRIYLCEGNYFPVDELFEAFPTFGWGSFYDLMTVLLVQYEGTDVWEAISGRGWRIPGRPREAKDFLTRLPHD